MLRFFCFLLLSSPSDANPLAGKVPAVSPIASTPLPDNALRLDLDLPDDLQARIDQRLNQLASRYLARSRNGALELPYSQLGDAAEFMVLTVLRPELVNVSEVIPRNRGETATEIDAETRSHLIEVTSGKISNGKKTRLLRDFLIPRAKESGKGVAFYVNFDHADPAKLEYLKAVALDQDVDMEFRAIPWDAALIKGRQIRRLLK